jgi:GTPase SAR1 family protein
MRDYLANEVRNVVVLGHSGAGKSSVVEACMYYTKAIDRYGNEKPIWYSGELTVPKGSFKAKLTGRSLNRYVPGAYVTLGFKGKTIK